MPRPKTKAELASASESNFHKLLDYIDNFNPEEQEGSFPPGTLNRNFRDILAHLHHWHLMFLNWYEVGMQGQKPAMPAEGHTWRTVPELNIWINEKYKDMSLAESRRLFEHSHQELTKIIEQHSNEELFEKKRYKWTGSTSLGAYLISATSSHYDWAFKLIKRVKKKAC